MSNEELMESLENFLQSADFREYLITNSEGAEVQYGIQVGLKSYTVVMGERRDLLGDIVVPYPKVTPQDLQMLHRMPPDKLADQTLHKYGEVVKASLQQTLTAQQTAR